MPVLATLLKGLLGNVYALILALKSSNLALKYGAMIILAGAYVACVVGFTEYIAPLLHQLFTSSYGQVIGLAFPPIAGNVLGGLVTLWGCVVMKRYYRWVVKIGVN